MLRPSRPHFLIAVSAALALLVAPTGATAAGATPPKQPAVGQLGGQGPCAKGTTRVGLSPRVQKVWEFVPTGAGVPRTGGTCGGKRPVILLSPGAGSIDPFLYQELIDNMVSNGYVVIFTSQPLLSPYMGPDLTYPNVSEGALYAASTLDRLAGGRMDVSNLGIWGHSLGAGMAPWLAQWADKAGWGRTSMWLSVNASYFAFKVGASGPISIPKHARVQVVHYDRDMSDAAIGIDIFNSVTVPNTQKDHIYIHTDRTFVADHGTVMSFGTKPTPSTHLNFYGVFRNYQALGDCARFSSNCDIDLSYMGTWSDGTPAARADVSDSPVDVGPTSPLEFTSCVAWEKHGASGACRKK